MSRSPISVGHDTVTVASTPVSLQTGGISGVPTHAQKADLQTNAPLRFWLDGTPPTPTSGFLMSAGEQREAESRSEIDNLRMIAVSGTATLFVNYKDA